MDKIIWVLIIIACVYVIFAAFIIMMPLDIKDDPDVGDIWRCQIKTKCFGTDSAVAFDEHGVCNCIKIRERDANDASEVFY